MDSQHAAEVARAGPPSPAEPAPAVLERRPAGRHRLVWPGFVLLLLLVSAGAGWFLGASKSVAASYLLGYALHADRSHTDMGWIRVGEPAAVRTTVRNIRSQATTLSGVETSCGCAAVNLDTLPLELQAGEEHELVLTVVGSETMTGRRLMFTARVFTDAGGPILTLRYSARVK